MTPKRRVPRPKAFGDGTGSHRPLSPLTQSPFLSDPDSQVGQVQGQVGQVQSEGSIKQQVREYLASHPTSKHIFDHKKMAFELGLDYKKHHEYLWKLVAKFKPDPKNGLGLKCPNFHGWRGFLYALSVMERRLVAGWVQSGSKNRCFVFRDALGRIEWFETGRVCVWVRKPVNNGKRVQLLANGFFKTGLISDIGLFSEWVETLKMKGVHCAVDTGSRLPYTKIDLFEGSNGVVVVLGDKSHPTCVELRVNLPEWVERLELLEHLNIRTLESNAKTIETFSGLLRELSAPKNTVPPDREMIV